MVLMAMFDYSTIAQLKVNSNGAVGIGYTGPISEGKLFINGDFGALCAGASRYWEWSKYTYNYPVFYASGNYSGFLGKPSYELYGIYSYYVYYHQLINNSDLNVKTNIRDLNNCLSKVLNIRGIKYDEILELSDTLPVNIREDMIESSKDKLGFIAQELITEFPELVKFNNETGLYGVNYIGMIPVLLESIKEQQTMIDNLTNEISALKSESSDYLKSALITTEKNLNERVDKPILYQNKPNPFNEDTEIRFYLPVTVNEARIYLYNMQGNQINNIIINQRNNGYEIIHGSELQAGMYMYTLIADGIEVDTKKMILTKE